MLFAADVLAREPGATIIYDVKSTRNLKPWIMRARRRAAALEDGALADQGQDEGSRRRARRRDERPHVLQGALVRLRRRALRRRAAARDPVARTPIRRRCSTRCPMRVSTPELNVACAEGEHHALVAQARRDARSFPARPTSSASTACASSIRTASASRARRTRRRSIVLRFEADDAGGARRGSRREFRRVLTAAKPGIALPF